ncbi:kinase-like domain-containing protein [Mycena amicta]|nr:kinase-like domain-containing protein [Mycena amicta]
MAMLHADDEAFAQMDILTHDSIHRLFIDRLGLVPNTIGCPEKQGSFHKVYFVGLSQAEGNPSQWSGKDVVLRVARKTIVKIKTENEIGLLRLLRDSGIPVPRVVFFSSDSNNPLGYEYDCLERIPYPSLADIWLTLSPSQLDNILDQFVEIFIKLFAIDVPKVYGSLTKNGTAAPVLEETMWQIPDIHRYFHAPPYNLTSETFASLNPTAFYTSWPDYISAFLKCYHHLISLHPSLEFLQIFLKPLQGLINTLDSADAPWVRRLRDSVELRPRLSHRDFHFANVLVDVDGTIKGIIDWEFAGTGAPFASRWSMINNCVGYLRYYCGDNPKAQDIVAKWPGEFQKRLEERAPQVAAIWARETDRDAVLGVEGNALSDVREYVRACLEVSIRGDSRIEKAKTDWKDVVEKNLEVLGF